MSHLYLDCSRGISGDMAVAALLDLGFPEVALRETVAALGLSGQVRLAVSATSRCCVGATGLAVSWDAPPPLRRLSDVLSLIEEGRLPAPVAAQAAATFRLLAAAEGRVHRVPPEEIHFHELGALDTLVDVVGFTAGLHHLGVTRVSASPVPWFRGRVATSHGPLPLPAPAVLELLRGATFFPGEAEEELVTPTGAALLATHAASFGPPPPLRLTAVGYGAGTRDGSLLRAVLGEEYPGATEAGWEEIVVLETNLDDLDPRLYPPLLERLLGEGALDAFLTPTLMKKGRPGTQLTALAPPAAAPALCDLLLRETSTLGVRVRPVRRRTAGRQIRPVETAYGTVRVKLSLLDGTVVGATPELEDCRILAQERSVPLKRVLAAAQAAAAALLP
ncbi:MAG: nickel pincer cofactor biosynthesis protein LarC [Thermaerobacter sp.]|nr:nickel pincer cofactor biosynthesis protein LarC [Thermaerobacter sp.]